MLKFFYRKPDFVVEHYGRPYLRRWYIIPKNKYFNIFLHHFLSSDEDRALHDHPWSSLGIILKGKYIEHLPVDHKKWIEDGDREEYTRVIKRFIPTFRDSKFIHRVELFKEHTAFGYRGGHATYKPVWTLFITGRVVRKWGFWCPFGFRPKEEFVQKTEDGNEIGRGCE